MSALVAPFHSAQRAAVQRSRSASQAYDATFGRIAALPKKLAGAAIGGAASQHASATGLDRLQRQVAWTGFLALAGSVLGVGAGLVLASGFDALWPGLALAMAGSGATPLGLWSATVGLSAMGVVGAFRVLALSPQHRPSLLAVRSAIVHAISGQLGWLAGWLAVAVIIGFGGGEPLAQAVFGQAAVHAGSATLGQAAGWTLGWAIYGAIAGALSGTVREDPAGWATSGFVFGAAGWAALRVLAVV
jgi:hypothetical protein